MNKAVTTTVAPPRRIPNDRQHRGELRTFVVCLANKDTKEGDCTTAFNGNENEPETVYLTVE